MKTVGYFFEHPTVSGAEASALELLARTDGRAFRTIPFAPPSGELASRLRTLGLEPRPWMPPRCDSDEAALRKVLARADLDVLHANTIELGRLTGRLSSECGVPAVAHIRAFGSLSARARRNLCGNRVLIAVSEAVKSHLVAQGIPEGIVRVVYNGVSLPLQRRQGSRVATEASIREELHIPPGGHLVAWLGQITVRKDPATFVEAARLCLSEVGDVHFVLAGDVFGRKEENLALEREVAARARTPPLRGRLHLVGWRRDPLAVLAAATCLAHTSRQEPLGRVLIEALAVGTPIVATSVGGTPEVAGRCAVLVPPGDAAGFARALAALLRDPRRRDALSAAGRDRWRRLFQADAMAAAVSSIWEEATT